VVTVGSLYVCATPIGHFDDVSIRFVETLKKVSLLACEDTRVTGILLKHLGIKVPLMSLEKFSEARRQHVVLEKCLDGESVALVSDAGTPAISDPGSRVIRLCRENGVPIVPVPGPSAVITLVSISGRVNTRFYFGEFFPRKESEAKKIFTQLQTFDCLGVFFESGQRIERTLTWIEKHHPQAFVGMAKELTKPFETYIEGSPTHCLETLKTRSKKGEWSFFLEILK